MLRRIAAASIVVALLATAVGAAFLFDTDESSSDDLQSVYATALGSASRCGPRMQASSQTEGEDSVEAIARDVEKLRDLDFTSEPEIEFLSADELADHVADVTRADLDEERTEIEIEALARLRVVPDDFDVDTFVEGSSEQILGLYDPEDKKLLVGNSGEFDPLGQLTIAHELDHALTDQVIGLPDLRYSPGRADAQLAERALIEGEATLLMQHYGLVQFPNDLQEALAGGATAESREAFASLPHYIQRASAFPYQEGSLFACEVYADGGWSAIDEAYGSPPTSTLEILFPDLYGSFDRSVPIDPNDPGDDWEFVETVSLGAVDLQWMFEAPGGRFGGVVAEPARQVSRWRGGFLRIWQQDDGLVVSMSIVEGDDLTGDESLTICDRLIRWYSESDPEADFLAREGTKAAWSFEGGGAAADCSGDQTRFVVAPDVATAVNVAEFR